MRTVHAGNFAQWREAARALLAQSVRPEEVDWRDGAGADASLFDAPGTEFATPAFDGPVAGSAIPPIADGHAKAGAPAALRIPRDLLQQLVG
jgi:hypothetical protein